MSEMEYESVEETPVVEETPEVVETPWSPSREEWQQVQQFGQYLPILGQMAEYLQGQQQESYEAPTYDPFNPDSVEAYVAHAVQQGVDQALGPYTGILGMVSEREGENMARAELARIQSSIGEFDHDQAILIALGLAAQSNGPDVAQALTVAAQRSQEYEKKIRADERERVKAELGALAGAPGEISGGAPAGENEQKPEDMDKYEWAVRKGLARRNPVVLT